MKKYLINADQYNILNALNKHQKVDSKGNETDLKVLNQKKYISDNKVTKQGKKAINKFNDYIKKNNKATNIVANLSIVCDIVIILTFIIEFFLFKLNHFTLVFAIIIIVLAIVIQAVASHYINKHFNL